MKRFWAFIAACLFLLLTACGGSTSTTEPIWQTELPNTGITVQVSGCTLEEKTASYWANPGAAGEPQSIMELYATDSAPLLEIAAPKAQVDIQFVQPVAGGMAAYDLALDICNTARGDDFHPVSAAWEVFDDWLHFLRAEVRRNERQRRDPRRQAPPRLEEVEARLHEALQLVRHALVEDIARLLEGREGVRVQHLRPEIAVIARGIAVP